MILRWILSMALMLCAHMALADMVRPSGTLGPLSIDMELKTGTDGRIEGRYRYKSKQAWLTLGGLSYGPLHIALTERYEGQDTGRLFLESDDTSLTGFWGAG